MENKQLSSEERNVTANWGISCDIECPVCGEFFDFMDEDEWYMYSQPGKSGSFELPYPLNCPKCKSELNLTGTNY